MIPGSGRSPGEGIGYPPTFLGFPCGSAGKETSSNAEDLGSIPGIFSWKREKLLTPVFRPGEFHGLYSPWGHKELDLTEQLSLSTGPKERLTRTVGFTRSPGSFLLLPFVSSNQTAWSHPIPFSPMSRPRCGLWLAQVHLIAPDLLLGCSLYSSRVSNLTIVFHF